jgi:hypothetical protein
MKNVADSSGNAASEERFAGQSGYRTSARREIGGLPLPGEAPEKDGSGNGVNVSSVMERPLPTQPSMSLTEVTTLTEPVFTPGGWLDVEPLGKPGGETVAEHPLLRGLLMELPVKGSAMPSREWLDRWFEATRSILELLYVSERPPGPRPRR